MRDREYTRRQILDSARQLIAVYGVDAPSVADICEAAGFTRGAFYSNFVDKEDLLSAILMSDCERVLTSLGDLLPTALSTKDIETLVDHFLRLHSFDQAFFVIQADLTARALRDPAGYAVQIRVLDEVTQRITGAFHQLLAVQGLELTVSDDDAVAALACIVERSRREGMLRTDIDPDPDRFARAILPSVIRGITRPVVDGPGDRESSD